MMMFGSFGDCAGESVLDCLADISF